MELARAVLLAFPADFDGLMAAADLLSVLQMSPLDVADSWPVVAEFLVGHADAGRLAALHAPLEL
eukprot:3417477-Alexandrium_andersonii.AAC.1